MNGSAALGGVRLRRDERCAGVRTMTWRTPVCTVRSGLKCRGRLGGEATRMMTQMSRKPGIN